MHHSLSNCADTRAALPLFVGGDLESQELAQVKAHLDDCETCRLHEDRARQARGALVSMLHEGGSAAQGVSVWEGVRAGLVEEGLLDGSGSSEERSSEEADVLVPRAAVAVDPSRATEPAVRPRLLARIPRSRVASFAAAAGLVFAFGVIHLLGDGSGLGSNMRPGDLAGDRGGSATSDTHAATHSDAPGYLRRVGPNGSAIHESALEMVPEQWSGIPRAGNGGNADVAGSRLRRSNDGQ